MENSWENALSMDVLIPGWRFGTSNLVVQKQLGISSSRLTFGKMFQRVFFKPPPSIEVHKYITYGIYTPCNSYLIQGGYIYIYVYTRIPYSK